MRPRLWKPILAIVVLLATIGAFIYFFATHPAARHQLTSLNPAVLLVLLGLYVLFTISLVLILEATLDLCKTRLRKQESLLLTIYSSIVNFFGPLQSGPGFRALYLKKRHGTKLKNYALASLMYYGFFAAFSGLFLISGLVSWQILAGIAGAGVLAVLILLRTNLMIAQRLRSLRLTGAFKLALATLLQVSLVAIIYYVELRSVNSHVSFHQTLVYTGAANFALFVSLTPGAIGFRESFLLFSRDLHHIDSATILSASLIDRAVYVVFLGLLVVLALSVHAKDRLKVSAVRSAEPEV